jgi:hypothetical protein
MENHPQDRLDKSDFLHFFACRSEVSGMAGHPYRVSLHSVVRLGNASLMGLDGAFGLWAALPAFEGSYGRGVDSAYFFVSAHPTFVV